MQGSSSIACVRGSQHQETQGVTLRRTGPGAAGEADELKTGRRGFCLWRGPAYGMEGPL